MKAELHIPTEQYGFIQLEVNGEIDDIIRKWFDFKEKFEARQKEVLKTTPKPF